MNTKINDMDYSLDSSNSKVVPKLDISKIEFEMEDEQKQGYKKPLTHKISNAKFDFVDHSKDILDFEETLKIDCDSSHDQT